MFSHKAYPQVVAQVPQGPSSNAVLNKQEAKLTMWIALAIISLIWGMRGLFSPVLSRRTRLAMPSIRAAYDRSSSIKTCRLIWTPSGRRTMAEAWYHWTRSIITAVAGAPRTKDWTRLLSSVESTLRVVLCLTPRSSSLWCQDVPREEGSPLRREIPVFRPIMRRWVFSEPTCNP